MGEHDTLEAAQPRRFEMLHDLDNGGGVKAL